MAHILIVEDEENLRYTIRQSLARDGHLVSEASNLNDARTLIDSNAFDLVLTDILLGRESGLELIPELRNGGYDGALVIMTAMGSVETAVQAMRDGADDYLQKPLSLEELSLQVRRWLEQQRLARRVHLYRRMEEARADAEECLGESDAWLETRSLAERLAMVPLGTDSDGSLPSILLNGETGVGKGVMARYIHECAVRAGAHAETDPPFVHVNCSALPPTLVEGELFGHEKGAFTDAREARPGLFEMADGGTIFLDEVTEMPLDLQAKLLLVVEQGTFRRVGGTRERTVRARVIAASNQDLEQTVEDGRFRRDLLYRLNTFTITIPPLRERQGDALIIAEAILERSLRQYGRSGISFGPEAIASIRSHEWKGNVRELINVVQRAAMLTRGPKIVPADLGLAESAVSHQAPCQPSDSGGMLRFDFESGVHTADEVETLLIKQALVHTDGNISQAAKLIGMQRSSLRYRIDRYGLADFISELVDK